MLQAFLDGRLFGTPRGAYPPLVVALHGWQRTSADFDAVLGAMSGPSEDPFDGAPISSIALDLPGFGASPAPPSAWGTRDYALGLLPLLEQLASPVILLGHSFGGRIALQLAVLAPSRVKGLVLTGVPLPEPGAGIKMRPDWRYRLIRSGSKLGILSENRLERARQRFGSRDYREATGVVRDVLVATVGEDYGPLLPRITLPVELVWGDRDTTAPLTGAQAALGVLSDAHLTVLPGVGHMVPLDAPEALRRALGNLVT